MTRAPSEDSAQNIATALEKASAGLLWMSESDYPFQVFVWEGHELTPETLLSRTGHPLETPIQRMDLDTFFAPATRAQDWQGAEEQATVTRFQDLVKVLKATLVDPQVFRVGEVELDLYIVGKTSTDHWVGLTTKAVET